MPTTLTPACYGVCCELHGQCARYQLIEHLDTEHTIATCRTPDGTRPMFKQHPSNDIIWTHALYLRFKDAYGEAIHKREADFKFEGHDFHTKYAMYLIGYLSSIGLSSNI